MIPGEQPGDHALEARPRVVVQIHELDGEAEVQPHVQGVTLERDPAFLRQVDLEPDAPAGGLFVMGFDETATHAQVVDAQGNGQRPEAAPLEWSYAWSAPLGQVVGTAGRH
jgi:hypothetical protein